MQKTPIKLLSFKYYGSAQKGASSVILRDLESGPEMTCVNRSIGHISSNRSAELFISSLGKTLSSCSSGQLHHFTLSPKHLFPYLLTHTHSFFLIIGLLSLGLVIFTNLICDNKRLETPQSVSIAN